MGRFKSGLITDVGLKHVAGMKELKFLDLRFVGTGVTDAGLKSLAGLKGLKHLNLSLLASVTDAGIAEFKKAVPGCTVSR